MSDIGVAFIGTGWMGSVQLAHLAKKPGVRIDYVVNPNIERARELVDQLGLNGARVTDNFDETLEADSVDAAWIVSPNSYHGRQAILSMEAGRHVFCEKPASTTYTEYLRELELDNQKPELRSFVDYILYFNPMERWLIDRVGEGAFGTIHQMQVNYRHPVNISGGKAWKLSKSIMGDALGMGVNHAVSAILFVMEQQSTASSVYAVSQNTNVRGFEADPVWTITVRFANGATATCLGNIDVANGYDLYHNVAGDKGGFVFDSLLDHAHKARYWQEGRAGGEWLYPLDRERCVRQNAKSLCWSDEIMLPDSGNVIDHQTADAVDHFLECIREGKESPLSFRGSSTITEIGWAAQVSALTGEEVKLPLDANRAVETLDSVRGKIKL